MELSRGKTEEGTQTESAQDEQLKELRLTNYCISEMYQNCYKIVDQWYDLRLLPGKLRYREEMTPEQEELLEDILKERDNLLENLNVLEQGIYALQKSLLKLANKINMNHDLD